MVGTLLRDHVDSYDKLEAVLVGRHRACPIALTELANLLRLTLKDARRTADSLCASGLWVEHADGRFSETSSAHIRTQIDALVQAYHLDSLVVVSKLSRQALLRLRGSAAFANAVARRRAAFRRVR